MGSGWCLENTPLLPQRVKSGSVSGFALLSLRSRNHARSAFKRFSRHQPEPIPTTDSGMLLTILILFAFCLIFIKMMIPEKRAA
jgi:hypothetical protein